MGPSLQRRCPLTIKFGKDVASLIYRWVWQSGIKTVNRQYHNKFEASNPNSIGVRSKKRWWIFYNYRRYNGDQTVVHSFYHGDSVLLPKNYWVMNELY
jgi:hypothetical protein